MSAELSAAELRRRETAALVGAFIRQERCLQKVTQRELAREAGIDQDCLSRLENGRVRSSFVILLDVLWALDLPAPLVSRLLCREAELRAALS